MKRTKTAAVLLILLLFVLACDIGNLSIDFGKGNSGESQGGSIEASIDSPSNGATLPMGPVEIAYHATSPDGVSAIELSINGEIVNSFINPESGQLAVAQNYTWQPNVSGSHTIRVRAQSASGAWSDYSATTISIKAEQQQQDNASDEQASQKPTKTPEATATPEEMTIFNVKHEPSQFYYASGNCGPREITISADVTHPDDAYAAILFIRFWDREGEGLTKWDSGRAMVRKSDEHFSVTLFSESIPNYSTFDFSVMYYQIVVQDKAGNRLARTEVVKEVLLDHCTS
ncbi:MAG: hypothetical protein J7L66_02070 [Anaerolineaceae bacterium]|nr:hypothetical protein [Anaerolineaceae bacterium]